MTWHPIMPRNRLFSFREQLFYLRDQLHLQNLLVRFGIHWIFDNDRGSWSLIANHIIKEEGSFTVGNAVWLVFSIWRSPYKTDFSTNTWIINSSDKLWNIIEFLLNNIHRTKQLNYIYIFVVFFGRIHFPNVSHTWYRKEQIRPDCNVSTIKHLPSVMVWSAISNKRQWHFMLPKVQWRPKVPESFENKLHKKNRSQNEKRLFLCMIYNVFS